MCLNRKIYIVKESDIIYNRIKSKKESLNSGIRVETPDGKLLGIFKSAAEIERLSTYDNFILNEYSNKGKVDFLKAGNIGTSCRTGNPYKGLYYEYN